MKKYRVWDISGGISQPLFQGGQAASAGSKKSESYAKLCLLANLKSL